MANQNSLLDDAWAAVLSNPGSVRKSFETAAKKDDDVGLALARFDAMEEHEDVAAALRAEGEASTALVLPLVMAACLEGEAEPRKVDHYLAQVKFLCTPKCSPALHQIIAKAQKQAALLRAKPKTKEDGDRWALIEGRAAGSLARFGETKEAERLLGTFPSLRTVLLPHGIGIKDAINHLEKLIASEEEDELRDSATLLKLLAGAKATDAVPIMIRFLRSGIFMHALDALATIGDPRGVDAARRLLKETSGDEWHVNIIKLACEHVLRVVAGEKFPLDLARRSLNWPTRDYKTFNPESTTLREMAMTALILHGDAKDRALVKRSIQAPYRSMREVAAKAFDKPPVLTAWDQGRIAFTKKNKSAGMKALAAALEDPKAIFLDLVIADLAEDTKSRPAVAAFIVREIEAQMNYPHYDEDYELDTDIQAYVDAGEGIASSPAGKKLFAASKNPWVRVRILGEDEDAFTEKDDAAAAKLEKGPRKVAIARVDHPPYFFPRTTQAVVADDAEAVFIVEGDSELHLFDPQKSVRVAHVTEEGKPITALAISADGARFAYARGNKITVRVSKTAAELSLAEMSSGVTALAFDPEGKLLAAGSEKGALRIFDAKTGKETLGSLKDAPGPVRGVGWMSVKRCVFLADKAKKSLLVDVDVPKEKRADVAIDIHATMLAVRGKTVATANAEVIRVHDAKLAPKVKIDGDEKAKAILEIALEGEKSLYVRYAERIDRIRFGGKAPKSERVGYQSVDRLLAAGERIYGMSDGSMTRFHEDKKGKVAEGVHYDHVNGIGVLPDGDVITIGWEGRVLRWKPEGGVAKTLFDRKGRVDSFAVSPNGERAYFDDEKNVRMIDIATDEVTVIVGGEDVEKDIAKHMPEVESIGANDDYLAWGDNHGVVHIVRASTGEETAAVTLSEDDVESCTIDAAGNVYAGSEKGELACIDAKTGTKKWARVEHGIDVLNGQLHGNPHRNCAYVHAGGAGPLMASLASDHTVRVFDGPSGERKLRVYRNVGIFNQVKLSPDQKRFAFTYGYELEVRKTEDGELECTVSGADLPGSNGKELTAVAWIDNTHVWVGTEGGALYRVTLE